MLDTSRPDVMARFYYVSRGGGLTDCRSQGGG